MEAAMEEKRFTWRSVVAVICLVLAGGGIRTNIEHGIPENAPPGFAVGLYIPAALLIVVAIGFFISEYRRRQKSGTAPLEPHTQRKSVSVNALEESGRLFFTATAKLVNRIPGAVSQARARDTRSRYTRHRVVVLFR
jgi:hypothetical protein